MDGADGVAAGVAGAAAGEDGAGAGALERSPEPPSGLRLPRPIIMADTIRTIMRRHILTIMDIQATMPAIIVPTVTTLIWALVIGRILSTAKDVTTRTTNGGELRVI